MKKKIKIIASIVLVLGVIAYILCYIFLKEQTTYFTECLIDFINKPLPIIGVSLVAILYFIYIIVVKLGVGKKTINSIISEKDSELAKIKQKEIDLEQLKEYVESDLKTLGLSIDELKELVALGFEYSRNAKVKEIASKIKGETDNGKENQDSETIKE